MKASLISAAALCMASGLAMAQDAECRDDAAKSGECQVVIQCGGGEGEDCVIVGQDCCEDAQAGTYKVKIMTDENGEMAVNLEPLVSQVVVNAIGAGQPEGQVDTHMTLIQKSPDHEYKVEIKNDDVKAWIDGDRVPGKRVKVTDDKIKILDEDGETVVEFARATGGKFGIGKGQNKIMLRQLGEDDDGPLVWEDADEGQVRVFGLGDAPAVGMAFAQPKDTPPVMIGITMGSLDEAEGDIDQGVFDVLDDHDVDSEDVFVVIGVVDGLPADKAGLKAGDVVVRVDGKWGVNAEKLRDVLMDKEPGDEIELAVVRKGKLREIEVELAAWNSEKLGMTAPLEWTFEGDAPNMIFRGSGNPDVERLLKELQEKGGKLDGDVKARIEEIIKKLGDEGAHGFNVLPRIETRRFGEGNEGFLVRPAPAPRDDLFRGPDMRGYEDRLAGIEERLDRLEHRIDRLINALQDRERDDD